MVSEFEPDVLALAGALTQRRWRIATAESCTGGLLAAACTAVSGSSAWFERGFVTYSNEAKQEMLGVPAELIQAHGAVSEAVALAMAEGAVRHARVQLSLAVTGVAGPTGGTPAKPVGTVWMAWCHSGQPAQARLLQLSGDRARVRAQTVQQALQQLGACCT